MKEPKIRACSWCNLPHETPFQLCPSCEAEAKESRRYHGMDVREPPTLDASEEPDD